MLIIFHPCKENCKVQKKYCMLHAGNHHITLFIMFIIIIIINNNYFSSFNFDDLDYIPPLHQNEFRLDSIACLKAKHDLSSGKLVVISTANGWTPEL